MGLSMDRGAGPQISWRAGEVPVSDRFCDPYYSLCDGAAEAAHVFLVGNGLPGRFRPGFRVAELGFGTGLNLLITARAWAAAGLPGGMNFTSFEAFPMTAEDMVRAWSQWPGLGAEVVLDAMRAGRTQFRVGAVRVELILGDARKTLPTWKGRVDAWYLDGFSPARNPELWEPGLMASVAAHTAPGGSFATYTAAGHVRRALAAAGFDVTRRAGFEAKRHMSLGRLA